MIGHLTNDQWMVGSKHCYYARQIRAEKFNSLATQSNFRQNQNTIQLSAESKQNKNYDKSSKQVESLKKHLWTNVCEWMEKGTVF